MGGGERELLTSNTCLPLARYYTREGLFSVLLTYTHQTRLTDTPRGQGTCPKPRRFEKGINYLVPKHTEPWSPCSGHILTDNPQNKKYVELLTSRGFFYHQCSQAGVILTPPIPSQGAFGNTWRYFGCHKGQGVATSYQHLIGRGQEDTSYGAQGWNLPPQRGTIWAAMR